MSEKTLIKGKDSDLESSIDRMRKNFQKMDIEIQEVSSLHPVPNVYSTHIRDAQCALIFTNGKGSSEKSSLASALGEFVERLSCNYFFADYYLGSQIGSGTFVHYPEEMWFDPSSESIYEDLLSPFLWKFYDPLESLRSEDLFELNSGAGERGICALPFESCSDSSIIYFPYNIIANLYVSNGMAAGNSFYEARVQALSEICERYAKNKIIAEGIALPRIPDEVLSRYAHIVESLEKLEAFGYRLRVCDASLGGVFPVICVTLINPENGSVLASFGAHPSFEVALERTVTELLQGRSLDQNSDFTVPSFNTEEVADPHNLVEHFINSTGVIHYDFFRHSSDFEFVDWDFEGDTKLQYDFLCELIQRLGFEIYSSSYEHLGMYACRIIVPGMSEIYPVEELVLNNNNVGAYYREYLLSLDQLTPEGLAGILENFEADELDDSTKVAEFIGVAPDPDTRWQTLQIGTLKGMIYLALREFEAAREYNRWSLHIADITAEQKQIHECLDALLSIVIEGRDLQEYYEGLQQLYGAELLEKSLHLVEGNSAFEGLHFPGLSLEGFERHTQLLNTYKKVQKLKVGQGVL